MSWSKQEFIKQAYEELGYASFDGYDLPAGQLETARRRLDAMLAQWNGKGVRIGYPLPSTPNSGDIDDLSEVPDSAIEAIILNLAVRLAPSIGKQASPDTKMNAKTAYDTLLSMSAQPSVMSFQDTLVSGAGNKSWRNGYGGEFIETDDSTTLLVGDDGELIFE